MNKDLKIYGLPKLEDKIEESRLRYKLLTSINGIFKEFRVKEASILVSTDKNILKSSKIDLTKKNNKGEEKAMNKEELTLEQRASSYSAQQPLYDFDFLIVPDEVKQKIVSSIARIQLKKKIFNEWNLKSIEPFPRTALNFYGKPGTGKTIAAHAIASYLERPITIASYAQIESKFHGDGPKNVEALFWAAERDRSILFIDEADSLLSKRLTNVTQGSEQAINSMRSQLLICLERFEGIVIFATNLVENYDTAFESRVLSIHFKTPNEKNRRDLWQRHLPAKLPLASDVSVLELAKEDLSGREIKNAVIETASRVAFLGKDIITQSDLLNSIELITESRISEKPQKIEISSSIENKLADYAKANIANGKNCDR